MKKIKYPVFTFAADGRRPYPENVTEIQKMPPPKNISSLLSFFGLISHYRAFLPHLHRAQQAATKRTNMIPVSAV